MCVKIAIQKIRALTVHIISMNTDVIVMPFCVSLSMAFSFSLTLTTYLSLLSLPDCVHLVFHQSTPYLCPCTFSSASVYPVTPPVIILVSAHLPVIALFTYVNDLLGCKALHDSSALCTMAAGDTIRTTTTEQIGIKLMLIRTVNMLFIFSFMRNISVKMNIC